MKLLKKTWMKPLIAGVIIVMLLAAAIPFASFADGIKGANGEAITVAYPCTAYSGIGLVNGSAAKKVADSGHQDPNTSDTSCIQWVPGTAKAYTTLNFRTSASNTALMDTPLTGDGIVMWVDFDSEVYDEIGFKVIVRTMGKVGEVTDVTWGSGLGATGDKDTADCYNYEYQQKVKKGGQYVLIPWEEIVNSAGNIVNPASRIPGTFEDRLKSINIVGAMFLAPTGAAADMANISMVYVDSVGYYTEGAPEESSSSSSNAPSSSSTASSTSEPAPTTPSGEVTDIPFDKDVASSAYIVPVKGGWSHGTQTFPSAFFNEGFYFENAAVRDGVQNCLSSSFKDVDPALCKGKDGFAYKIYVESAVDESGTPLETVNSVIKVGFNGHVYDGTAAVKVGEVTQVKIPFSNMGGWFDNASHKLNEDEFTGSLTYLEMNTTMKPNAIVKVHYSDIYLYGAQEETTSSEPSTSTSTSTTTSTSAPTTQAPAASENMLKVNVGSKDYGSVALAVGEVPANAKGLTFWAASDDEKAELSAKLRASTNGTGANVSDKAVFYIEAVKGGHQVTCNFTNLTAEEIAKIGSVIVTSQTATKGSNLYFDDFRWILEDDSTKLIEDFSNLMSLPASVNVLNGATAALVAEEEEPVPSTSEEPTSSEEPSSSEEPTSGQEPTSSEEPSSSEETTSSGEPSSSEEPTSGEEPTSSEEPSTDEPTGEPSDEPTSDNGEGDNTTGGNGNQGDGEENPGTGVTVPVSAAMLVLAAGAVTVLSKKRK